MDFKEKWVNEGLLFTILAFVTFKVIAVFQNFANIGYGFYGFPFPVYEFGLENFEKITPINLVLDIIIILGIGFGISFLKNKIMVKK